MKYIFHMIFMHLLFVLITILTLVIDCYLVTNDEYMESVFVAFIGAAFMVLIINKIEKIEAHRLYEIWLERKKGD